MNSVSDPSHTDPKANSSPPITSHSSAASSAPASVAASPSPAPSPDYTTSYCPIKNLTVVSKTSNASPAMATDDSKLNDKTDDLKLHDKTFTQKAQIKPWLQTQLQPTGIDIVIERSDDTKIVFKCKYQPCPKSKSKVKTVCPFRIRANYSIRLKLWSLVVVNKSHNHAYNSVPNPPTNAKTSAATARVTKPSVPSKISPSTLTPKISPLSDSNLREMLSSSNFSFNDNTSHINLKVQIRRIEDTLKTIETLNYIPEDSKERIVNSVLVVLNNLINEAAMNNNPNNTNTNTNNTNNNTNVNNNNTNVNINNTSGNIILPPISNTLPPPPKLTGELIKLPKLNLNDPIN